VNIVFVSAESTPFVKVGGLADVVGTLPAILKKMGHRVCIVLPHHGRINDKKFGITIAERFDMSWNGSVCHVEVSSVVRDGVSYYFIRGWPYFSANEDFVYSSDEGIDVGRFLFFSEATLLFIRQLAAREGWAPDIFHVNDWHTGTLPFVLRRVHYDDPLLRHAGVLMTIHNMAYQGYGIGWHLEKAHFPWVDHPLLRVMGKHDNCLAIGLAYSTMLNTVSPRYAREIIEPEGGYGLDGLLEARQSHLVGILNGIDTQRWNPAASPALVANYDAHTLDKRTGNKLALQAQMGLPERVKVPVVGTVIRLVDQKGPDIMMPAVRYMLTVSDVQFVLLGAGAPPYEEAARALQHDFPTKASVYIGFDEALSERIYAGVDMFLMPSLFEPCGIGQMIAMRYGSVPVVRQVGGLADTVDPEVGYLFADYHPGALGWAMGNALYEYEHLPERWQVRQNAAMLRDYSWERSAQSYSDLYERTLAVHRSYAMR